MNTAKPQQAQQVRTIDPAVRERMRPGPEHAQLAKTIGSWDVDYTHWMQEGAPPVQAKGTAVFSAILDGRFIREDFTGEVQGREFAGIGTMGYDRVAKVYVNTWCDNMGTGILCTTGTASRDGKDIQFEGRNICPATLALQQVRHVYALQSNDRFSMTMYAKTNGAERKTMEVHYTRLS
jgi:hypothetical protein